MLISPPLRTTTKRADRRRADARFTVAKQASQDAGQAFVAIVVRSGALRVWVRLLALMLKHQPAIARSSVRVVS